MIVIKCFVIVKRKKALKERLGNKGDPEPCLVPLGV